MTTPPGFEPCRPTGREENTLNRKELMTRLLDERFGQRDFDRQSPGKQQKTSEPVLEGLVERQNVLEMMEVAVDHSTVKLEAQLLRVMEDIFFGHY